MHVRGFAAPAPRAPLEPFAFDRRDPGPREVLIEILFSGICHSDVHSARNEWDEGTFPMVPGHEIVGRVVRVGDRVAKVKAGDRVGVGCMVASCRSCESCRDGFEQYCERFTSWTYNSTEQDGTTPTLGGYSKHIVVDEHFVLRVPERLPLAQVAPLLCAGITTYSPLRKFGVRAGSRVGVVGLGGLGHMAVKLAVAMGAEVTVFSTSPSKDKDARALGARDFVVTRDAVSLAPFARRFDVILDTVSAKHDVDAFLELLRRDGALVLVGLPPEPLSVEPFSVVGHQRSLAGSNIGGIALTQEMLDFCGERGIVADVEVIPASMINEAYERMVRGDVRFRFVIDASTF